MKNRYVLIPLLILVAGILTGCGAAAVGVAGYGGYKGATDQRSVGTMVDDSVISTSVKTALIADDFVKARHIDVDVLNGVVYLIGRVESESQKQTAEDIARDVNGVKRVENQLGVGKTSAVQIMYDIVLLSKIKTALLKDENIRSTNIDVDVNNYIITLTGIVRSQNERNKALSITREIAGNLQIVNNLSVK